MTIRVVIADDQKLIRAGLVALIGSAEDIDVVGQAVDGREAVLLARTLKPDVVLMDIRMPDIDGLTATDRITQDPELSSVRVVVLTTFQVDQYVVDALRCGASGFLDKGAGADELTSAIRVVFGGDSLLSPVATKALISKFLNTESDSQATDVDHSLDVLTDREREIMALAALGRSNDTIAVDLFLSPLTVKTHVNRAMTKLGARDRAQLVVLAYRSGLVRPHTD